VGLGLFFAVVPAAVLGAHWLRSSSPSSVAPWRPPAPAFLIRGDAAVGRYLIARECSGRPACSERASLQGAIAVFGAPATRVPRRGVSCRLTWPRVGLTIDFFTGGRTCRRGEFLRATVSDGRWGTDLGLRVGDPKKRIPKLYPRARLIGGTARGSWRLIKNACGASSLSAATSDGKVETLDVFARSECSE
jgi:hypothetical protein